MIFSVHRSDCARCAAKYIALERSEVSHTSVALFFCLLTGKKMYVKMKFGGKSRWRKKERKNKQSLLVTEAFENRSSVVFLFSFCSWKKRKFTCGRAFFGRFKLSHPLTLGAFTSALKLFSGRFTWNIRQVNSVTFSQA